jgi:hypothetical protein
MSWSDAGVGLLRDKSCLRYAATPVKKAHSAFPHWRYGTPWNLQHVAPRNL